VIIHKLARYFVYIADRERERERERERVLLNVKNTDGRLRYITNNSTVCRCRHKGFELQITGY
jgi:hypothetical protein